MCHHVLVLDAHNTTTPGSSELFILIELSAEVLGEEFQILIVFLLDLSQGDTSSGLLMNQLSKSCLSLDEAEWDALLSAKSREEHEHFDWVDIVSHHHKLCLAFLNECCHVVKTELQNNWLGSFLGISTASLSLSFLLQSGLLIFFCFGLVLCK